MKKIEELVDENYKNCKDRALSILYSITEYVQIEQPYNSLTGGGAEDNLTEKQKATWQSLINEVAEHVIEIENDNKEDNVFWLK